MTNGLRNANHHDLRVELIKIVWLFWLFKQIKLDYTAFAVETFKLVMHFV